MTGRYRRAACAACQSQRRVCKPSECILALYFPPNERGIFRKVHKLYGLVYILRIVNSLQSQEDKDDAILSMKFEAEARANDPVRGCQGLVCDLGNLIAHQEQELETVKLWLEYVRAAPPGTRFQLPDGSVVFAAQNRAGSVAPPGGFAGGASGARGGQNQVRSVTQYFPSGVIGSSDGQNRAGSVAPPGVLLDGASGSGYGGAYVGDGPEASILAVSRAMSGLQLGGSRDGQNPAGTGSEEGVLSGGASGYRYGRDPAQPGGTHVGAPVVNQQPRSPPAGSPEGSSTVSDEFF